MLSGHQLQVQDNEQWEGGREGGRGGGPYGELQPS